MPTIKLSEGQRKIEQRVSNPIQTSSTSDLQYFRKRQEANKLYGQLQGNISNLSKEEADYVTSLNELNENFEYPGYYEIENEEIVEKNQEDIVETKVMPKYDVSKEESEFIQATESAKQAAKKYAGFIGTEQDVSSFDEEVKNLLEYKESSAQERVKLTEEEKTKEKAFYENILTERKTEFNTLFSTKPIPIGKSEEQYIGELNTWINVNQEVLNKYYDKSVSVLSGNIKLNESQQALADYTQNELTGFATFKGATDAFSGRILSTSPKYAYISPAGAPSAIQIPFFEGEYKEFDPSNFEIITKESKVLRYNRLGAPVVRESVTGTTKLPVNDIMVKEYIIQKNLPNWGFKGNFSQDVASIQKREIVKKIADTKFNNALTLSVAKYNASNKNGFVMINPKTTTVSISNFPKVTKTVSIQNIKLPKLKI